MTRSATKTGTVSTTHTIFVAAPPRVVYDLLADAAQWPLVFSPSVHVERLEAGATEERLRLWAVANGAIRNWTSRRVLDPDGLRIRFRQESPLPPVASMSGEWVLVPLSGNVTSVVLLHEFRALGDDPANTALIKQAVDRNSTAELAELKTTAELGDQLPYLVHSFADSVIVKAGLGPTYDFLYRVSNWPRELPHITRVVFDEAVPNVQTIEMDTTASPDGMLQTVRMVRVCSPYHSIVYKQTHPPELLAAHLGGWYLYPTVDGVRVTAHNTVMIRPGKVDALSPNPAIEQAVDMVRQSLRDNCLAILQRARKLIMDDPEQLSLSHMMPTAAMSADSIRLRSAAGPFVNGFSGDL